MYSSQLLKGTFETIILKMLAEKETMYGYEINREVKNLSEGEISFPPGSLYPLLHRMEEEGLVSSRIMMKGKRSRRYYDITDHGRETAQVKMEEFMNFARTMINVLKPNN